VEDTSMYTYTRMYVWGSEGDVYCSTSTSTSISTVAMWHCQWQRLLLALYHKSEATGARWAWLWLPAYRVS